MFQLALQRATKGQYISQYLNKDGVKFTAKKNGDCSTSCSTFVRFEFDNVKYRNFMLNGNYELSATVNNGYVDQKVVYDNFNVGYIENSSLSSAILSVADNGIQQNIKFEISGVGPNAGNPDIHVHTVYSGAVTMKGSRESESTVEGTINARNYISIEKGKIDQIKEDYQSSRTMNLIGTDLVGIKSSAKIRNNCEKGELYGDFLSQISSLIINNAEGCYTLDELPAPGGNSDNTTTIIIVVVVVVVVVVLIAAGVGGFFLWKKFGSKKDENEASV